MSGAAGAAGPASAKVDGLALLDKPPGMTSFEALAALKRALATGRVGHTGTLDRFARGLIVALAGRLTRLAPLFSGLDKRYTATVRFGEETDTLDPEGTVTERAPVPALEALEAALPGFVGEIEQVPPLYSAVHHEGERAYRLARRGERPELRRRRVRVHALELLRYDPPLAELAVDCSAGTYVRSLARDLALACGSRATVSALVRTAVGPFALAEAVEPGAFEPVRHLVRPSEFLPRLAGVAVARIDGPTARRVASGAMRLEEELEPWPAGCARAALLDPEEELVAVVEREVSGRLRYLAVLAAPAGAAGVRSRPRTAPPAPPRVD